MNNTDTSDLTGLPSRLPKAMKLNEVRFNGKDGEFEYVDVLNRKDGEKAEKTSLGKTVDFIFLRQRRRIVGFNRSTDTMYISTEHNGKDDNIYLFGVKEKGTANELYEKYKDIMHTERVVYGFLLRQGKERELVRVIIKGSTLNWKREGKAPTTVDYFSYVQDDKREGHIYEYVTRMSPVKESSPLGVYYSINFTLGTHLKDDQIAIIVGTLNMLKDYVAEQDAYYKVAKPSTIAKDTVATIDAEDDKDDTMKPAFNGDDYPQEEGVNVDDIPF
jgi:hypothetical protein